jgi:cation diffusion facilitator family transporter
MTKFLVHKFINNHENVKDKAVRNSYAFLAAIVGMFCNIVLFAVKFFVGYLSSSISVMSDSFNNLSDVSSSFVVILGFKIANKPADKKHPFGYGRSEYLTTLLISIIIMYLGYSFLKESIHNIFYPPVMSFNFIFIFILVFSALVKIWLSIFNKKLGMAISSKTLIATCVDCKNDVIITFTTIFSLVFTKFTNIVIDGYIGTLVSFLLLLSGFSILKETVSSLLGEPTDKKLISDIKQMVKSYDGILGIHDLIVHNYGPNKIIASLHAEVANDMQISACHDIIERVEKDVANNLNIELVIHADPIAINDPQIKKLSSIVNEYIKRENKNLNAHDFRLVQTNGYTNFIFDLIIPFEYKKNDIDKIKKNLQEVLSNYDKKVVCIINFETGYN